MRPALIAGAVFLFAAAAASTATAQPRVNVQAVSVSSANAAVEGGSIDIAATFQSTGADPAPSFRWSAYLTVNGSLNGGHTLGTFGPITLSGSTPRTLTQNVQLPAGVTGRWELAIQADVGDAVEEIDEYDNVVFATSTLVIRSEAPDVDAISARPRETALQAGATVHIDFTVMNRGEVATTVTVGGYLSDDDVLTPSDALIGTADVTLNPGQTSGGSITGVVPAGSAIGDYTAGIIADAAGLISEISETNNSFSVARVLNVYTTSLSITTTDLPGGTVTIAYHALLEASGGDGHYRWTVSSGSLPDGLALDADTGVISGTPVASGTFNLELSATSRGITERKSFSITVLSTGAPLSIVSRMLGDGTLNHEYEQFLFASGGEPPYTWTLVPDMGIMPPGLDLRTDGIVSGIPTTIGLFHFRIQVEDRAGAIDTVELAVDVSPRVNVLVLQKDLPAATVGVAVDYALQATGGIPPYIWEALSSPPPGLTVTEQGHITGTPSQVGRFPVRVRATDTTSVGNNDTTLLQIEVNDDGALSIVTDTLPPVVVRTKYEVELTAMGGELPYTWSLVPGDHLPTGFFLTEGDGTTHPENTAAIRGTAVRAQFHAFAVQVVDAYGRRAQRVLLLEVPRPPSLSSSGCVCVQETRGSSLFGTSAVFAGFAALGLALARVRRRRRSA